MSIVDEEGDTNLRDILGMVPETDADLAMPVTAHNHFWCGSEQHSRNSFYPRTPIQDDNTPPPSEYTGYNSVLTRTPPPSSAEGGDVSWSSGSSSPKRACKNCHATETPFWRRAHDGNFFCNACGLYLKTHKKMRPLELQLTRCAKRIKTRADVCCNCGVSETPLWRRIATGETVCNACGLYYKLHGAHRALGSKKTGNRRGNDGKQRSILPKYIADEVWHQYCPPKALQTSYAPMIMMGSGKQSSNFHPNMDMNSLFMHHPYPSNQNYLIPSPIGQQSYGGTTPDNSLDDSMRWFSSTCLDSTVTTTTTILPEPNQRES